MCRAAILAWGTAMTGLLSDCGTLGNLGLNPVNPHTLYGGVVLDVKTAGDQIKAAAKAKDGEEFLGSAGVACLLVADLPLSAVADTLTLPATIPVTLERLKRPDPQTDSVDGTDSIDRALVPRGQHDP